MEKHFESYIQTHHLIEKKQKLLLAVSGGVDSVVMANLFISLGYTIGFAHCNFNLRGEESNLDALFVKQLAEQFNCSFYTVSFDTKVYAHEHKLSIEMAARNLRYEWFQTIMNDYSYVLLATAHHKEDNAETLLLNIIRGTGIKGLLGIQPKHGNIIRPMLCFDKKDILDYAHNNRISFRIDQSNLEINYKRNKIRNSIYPLLKEINPSITQTINENIERFRAVHSFYTKCVFETLKTLVKAEYDCYKITIADIKDLEYKSVLLYEWLSQYGFTDDSIEQICLVLNVQSGKRFLSKNYVLFKDRTELILSRIEKKNEETQIFTVEDFNKCTFIQSVEINNENQIDFSSKGEYIEYFDCDALQFPLSIRTFNEGDSMIPFGMKGTKKLSDIFIDYKVPVYLKEKIPILVDKNGQITWIVGYRISDKVKITETTRKVLKITINKKGSV